MEPAVKNAKHPTRKPTLATVNVPINYVEDEFGNITIDIPASTTVKKDDVAEFSLVTGCDATGFQITFKGTNPFEPTGNPINHHHPNSGKCKGVKGVYPYTLVITTVDNTTVTLDPVIIVDP
jgi:hypothetical protein